MMKIAAWFRLLFLCSVIGIVSFGQIATAQDASERRLEYSFVSWSPDGTMISLNYENGVDVIDSTNLQVLNSFVVDHRQYDAPLWSPDGTKIAIANGSHLDVWQYPWDVDSVERVASLPQDEILRLTDWSPDGKRIVSSDGFYMKVWDTGTWELLTTLGPAAAVDRDIKWSPDSSQFATAQLGGQINLFESQNYVEVAILGFNPSSDPDGGYNVTSPNTIDWSPDGQFILIGAEDGQVRIFDVTVGTQLIRFEEQTTVSFYAHSDGINTVAWSPDGNVFVTGSRDGTIKIWDSTTYQFKQRIEIPYAGNFWSVAWSPDGSKLAYGKPDGTVAIVEVPAGDGEGTGGITTP